MQRRRAGATSTARWPPPCSDRSATLYAAARGAGATLNGEPIQLRAARAARTTPTSPPSSAATGSSAPGVRESAHALLDRAGLLRHAGPGTLELAWVAAGRLDAWVQPDTDPWDWLPGALLVTEAGGDRAHRPRGHALARRRPVSAR